MSDRFAWTPSEEHLARSNVARFMKKHGIPDLDGLIRRSIDDIEWFWEAIVEDLDIQFFSPYRQVLDDSAGIAWPRWFVGGTINLAYNCVDKHAQGPRRDAPAVIWEGEDGPVRSLTFAELASETNRAANALKRLGVGVGDRVGLLLPMLPETVAAFLACAKVGAVSVPIFSGFGAQAVADRLDDCQAKVLITADAYPRKGKPIPLLKVAAEAAASCPSVRHVLVVRRSGDILLERPGRDLWWDEALAVESAECPSVPLDSEAPLFIGYTSGTTGKPKGVVHVHAGLLVKLAQEVAHQVDCRAGDRLHWSTDLGWIMGPWKLIGTLALGGTLVLYEGAPDFPAPDRLWHLVERHRVTILGISPTLVRSLMRHGDDYVTGHDLSTLRILGSTGEPWNPTPWTWYFERVGGGRCPLINFSGGTEVGACLLSPTPITPLKPCTLGGPALGMDVEVFDADGHPVRGLVGELVCRKPWPSMTRGLWNDGTNRYEKTYWSRWPGVWVHGDWASIDEDGLWFLHGRSDDTIKVSGKRIGPAEIESALVGHPLVAEAAAVGLPDAIKGEAVRAFVVLRPGVEAPPALQSELRDRVGAVLGRSFVPESVAVVADLPRTRSGKILRRALRARLLGEDPGDLSSLENPGALEALPGSG
ncbi:MAG TPA: AMP-binding protein [Isosphaeraceae bacterium]|jgi:acetyl-CoA synthetase|nr:AMP-binding protein [Isosphaeraceae bacterium]